MIIAQNNNYHEKNPKFYSFIIVPYFAFYLLSAFLIAANLLYGAIATTVAGLALSITGIVLSNNNPDKFSGKGMSVAGMIIGSIMCGILLILAILFFLL